MQLVAFLSVPIALFVVFVLFRRFQKYAVTKHDVAFWPAWLFYVALVLFLFGEITFFLLYMLYDDLLGPFGGLAIGYCVALPLALMYSKEKITRLSFETFQYTNFLGKTTTFSLSDVLDAQIQNGSRGFIAHSITTKQKSIVLGRYMRVEAKFWNRILTAARKNKKLNETVE